MLPPNMIGLTDEQIVELKLKDELGDVCVPSGGYVTNVDPVGRRNGRGMYIYIVRYCEVVYVDMFLRGSSSLSIANDYFSRLRE